MQKNIQNIIQLILTSENGKYSKYLPNSNTFEIKTFESTQEHILDIYNIRLQNIKQQGKSISGLYELVKNLKDTQIDIIKTTILTDNNEKIAIFSDKYYKQLIGIIFFTKIAYEK